MRHAGSFNLLYESHNRFLYNSKPNETNTPIIKIIFIAIGLYRVAAQN